MSARLYFVLKYFSFTFDMHFAKSGTCLYRHILFHSFDDAITKFNCTYLCSAHCTICIWAPYNIHLITLVPELSAQSTLQRPKIAVAAHYSGMILTDNFSGHTFFSASRCVLAVVDFWCQRFNILPVKGIVVSTNALYHALL